MNIIIACIPCAKMLIVHESYILEILSNGLSANLKFYVLEIIIPAIINAGVKVRNSKITGVNVRYSNVTVRTHTCNWGV